MYKKRKISKNQIKGLESDPIIVFFYIKNKPRTWGRFRKELQIPMTNGLTD